jgi:hypothetical protein
MDTLAKLGGRVAASLAAQELVIVSGIPPGSDGTGRLVAHLEASFGKFGSERIRVLARPERLAAWQLLAWWRARRYGRLLSTCLQYGINMSRFLLGIVAVLCRPSLRMVLLHPQNLGYRLSLQLLRSRRVAPLLYLLDNSYFCIASYNHLQGAMAPCTKCADRGPDEARSNNCRPFPRPDWLAQSYVKGISGLVRAGRVRICAQNLRQAELAQRFFALTVQPPVVGLWTQDWDELRTCVTPATRLDPPAWDVLFHGHCLSAKGALWLAAVAQICPDLRFAFPFPRPAWFPATDNCHFVPCTWDSGLREMLAQSRFVAVPSLWSAPIEGALVKSIALARAVIVAENVSSYSSELPDSLVLRLSSDPPLAASRLRAAIEHSWAPDAAVRSLWLRDLIASGDLFALRLAEGAVSAA